MKLRKLAAVMASVAVAGAMAVSASAETAGLMMQCGNWSHRNTLNQSNGIYEAYDEEAEEAFRRAIPGWSHSDTEINCNGQYMVSYKHGAMEDAKDGIDSYWNILRLETNIKVEEYPDVTISIDKLYVDGREVTLAESIGDAQAPSASGTKHTDGDNTDVAEGQGDSVLYDETIIESNVEVWNVEIYNTWSDNKWISSSDDFGRDVVLIFTIDGFKEPEDGNRPVVDYTPAPPQTDPPATEPPATSDAPTTDAPTSSDAPTSNAPTTTAASSSSSSDNGWVVWVIVGAVVVVAVVVVVIIKKKK